MKKILFFALILALLSCSKYSTYNTTIDTDLSSYHVVDALEDFSVILSAAVYNEPDLREFLKNEAQKGFDKDNDIFLPWTMNMIVKDNTTFYELLKSYDSNQVLDKILEKIPLLTILVPDWTWIHEDCFGLDNWNTDSNLVGVSFRSYKSENTIYFNGKASDVIPLGTFPSYPVLIVKENERMRQSIDTKSGPMEFEFADPAFDPSLETKGNGVVHEIRNLPYEEPTNLVETSELTGRVATAYSMTCNNPSLTQRDYIYYNMTSQRDSGAVDFRYQDILYKFRFSDSNVEGLYDDPINASTTGRDYIIKEYWYNKQNTPGGNIDRFWLTEEAMLEKDWGDGTAEIYLTFYIGDQTRTYVKSIPFKEAFYVSRVDQIREENWLGANMYRHYYIEKSWLVPKWIEANYSLVTWDLSTYPKGFLVKAEEYDKGAERTQTFSQEFSYATNFKTTGEVSGSNKDSGTEVNLKLGWEYGSSTEKKESSSFTEKYSENTDFLGSQWVYYHNDIILGYSSGKAIVKTYTTGSIDFMILPIYE